ncbi:uncharacterized protein LOC100883750 isoform X3 [Megachile rotundata]|uniref:uncharacterized protein LOC100883750 isoform X3 n=1 Tax=Megachile rotundata TaxID=143995 RepID=UPI003FD3345F
MQWRRQRRVTHVIGSSNHVLLLARYQDAPPGEEDEEEGLRNGFVKGQENDSGTHSFSRNGQGGYKGHRSGLDDTGTRSHKDDSSGSPLQPKIIFNEDEYTRITTPRQDMLFKKGYLSKKKPWAGNANTSATSSTTESQSASHSTADGSETTEDQQLLDRDYSTGKYPPMMKPEAQLGYGTFYDHASGYYYEYPVMLVGPAPVPAQVAPSVLTAVPCAPVPLRPIEWINPIFVPKLNGQPYYMMDYEANQCAETAVVSEEQESTMLPVETSNGVYNESCTGSVSCNGSVVGETEEQTTDANALEDEQPVDEQNEEQLEETHANEQHVEEQQLENGLNDGPYMEPLLMQQPVYVSHMTLPQPYMYPGHYMFGPPLINVNGVTIQGGPMIRTMDVGPMSTASAKRRKKKNRRKQRRFATGNTEGNTDEEEGEYSSECDTGLSSSRLSWTACSTSTTTTTTTSSAGINRPLNPECQEFKLRQVDEPDTSLSAIPTSTPTSDENSTNQSSTLSSNANIADNENNEVCNGVVCDDNQKDDKLAVNFDEAASSSSSLEKSQSTSPDATNPTNEANRLTNHLFEEEEATCSTNKVGPEATLEVEKLPNTNDNEAANDASSDNDERPSNEMNGVEEQTLVNGKIDSDSNNEDTPSMATVPKPSSPCNDERVRSRSITPKTAPLENGGIHEENRASLSSSKSLTTSLPKRKYNAKGTKFVREPTPGPDLDSTEPETDTKLVVNDLNQSLENLENLSKPDSMFERCNDKLEDDQASKELAMEKVCNHLSKEDPIEASNEDSGFESQTRLSDYPITDAVTEWLRRANSPDIFITSNVSGDSETEDEDDVDEEPPKNLQGNPMPALSANGGVADNASLSRTTSCSEFARISNVKSQEQPEATNAGSSRKKRDAKKRSGERRRVRHMDGRLNHEVVSSSDSCGHLDDPVRRKNNPRQQDTVGDVCEFTDKDSVAGMRVASNSRMDSKRVNVRRTKRQGRSGRDLTSTIDTKTRRADENDDEGIVEDTMNVRTFEKGEIVVSEEGKLLTTSAYEPTLLNGNDACKSETRNVEERKRLSSGEEENCSGIMSLDSIEEPDVLECWETETIEPVITPKKMLQCEGVLCEGEAAEDDSIEVEQVNIDYVQKYYRLARESVASVEEETDGCKVNVELSASSKTVPNMSEQMVEIPTQNGNLVDGNKNVPIDEAFEVYESCYTGKTPILPMDSKVFKPRTLYGQDGEHPIPCRAVCCNIQ